MDVGQMLLLGGGSAAGILAVLGPCVRELSKRGPRKTKAGNGLWWLGRYHPVEIAEDHFMVVGATKSGKTVTLRLLMQSVFPRLRAGSNERALVFDGKGDLWWLLHDMGASCPIINLNPVDSAGYCWDIGMDVCDVQAATNVAKIFVPKEQRGGDRHWPDTARILLRDVFKVLVERSAGTPCWTLRDAVCLMQQPHILRQVLLQSPQTRGDVDAFFNPDRTFKSTFSTLRTFIDEYATAAGGWHAAYLSGKRLSLNRWLGRDGVGESSVVVLPRPKHIQESLDPLYQVFVATMNDLLLAHEREIARYFERGQTPAKTWMFLDEAPEAGKLGDLGQLLMMGRSKGCIVTVAFQDIESMRDVYGGSKPNSEKLADAMLGQVGNIAVLSLDSPQTVEWAKKVFGGRYKIVWRKTQGKENGKTQHREWHDWFEEKELLYAPPPSLEDGVKCFAKSRGDTEPRKGVFPFAGLLADSNNAPTFKRRPDSELLLGELTEDDLARISLPEIKLTEGPKRKIKATVEAEAKASPKKQYAAFGLDGYRFGSGRASG